MWTNQSFDMYSMHKTQGGRGTPYGSLYGEAPPKRGTFFRLQVFKRVGFSQVEVPERVGKFSYNMNGNCIK